MNEITKYLREIGAKGGKARGKTKRRGDSNYYKGLAEKAVKARKAK